MLRRSDRLLGVKLVRCRYVNDVDLRVGEQTLQILISLPMKIPLELLPHLGSPTGPCHDADPRIHREGLRHQGKRPPETDYADTDCLCHCPGSIMGTKMFSYLSIC